MATYCNINPLKRHIIGKINNSGESLLPRVRHLSSMIECMLDMITVADAFGIVFFEVLYLIR